jgi:outer membrane protein assembly factor BamB
MSVLSAAVLFVINPCLAEIIIVDDEGPADFNNIQAAIDDSNDGDIIYVFPGVYRGVGNRDIDFGGRAITVQSVVPEDPYIVAATVVDCNSAGRGFYFHSGEDGNSVLDGLTITNGNADRGGAIRIAPAGVAVGPTIANCIITGNTATSYGGGTYGGWGVIANCTITGNTATVDGGGVYACPGLVVGCTISDNWAGQNGGGIAECSWVTDCLISGNEAVEKGGGIYNIESSADIIACMFRGNSAAYGGGLSAACGYGLHWYEIELRVGSCAFSGNNASIDGGGLYSYCGLDCYPCCAYVSNCTFSGNHAASAGGGLYGTDSTPGLVNCVFWGNTDSTGTGEFAQISGSVACVGYSCIQDDDPNDASIPFGGEDSGNIDDNPMFVRDPNDGGDGWGVGDNDDFGDLHLQSGSPCINAGRSVSEFKVGQPWDWDPYQEVDVNVDIDGQPRIMGWIVDMGADEFYMPMIVVTRPAGGEVWASGSWHQITWISSAYEGTVDILLSTNGGGDWQSVDNGLADTGSYGWQVPQAIDSNQCVISVVPSVPDPNVVTVESGLFTIHPYVPGAPVISKWESLGGDFDRVGLSEDHGPQFGCVKWEFEVDGAISASITVGPNEMVYVPCEDGNLYALDANGSVLWTYEANSALISAATLGPDGTAYVGSKTGRLFAIDIGGNVRWTHTTEGLVYSSPAVSTDGNQVYVCSEDGKLYALSRDGSELWSFETAGFGVVDGAILASPTIADDGTVYVAGMYDSNLYALDPNDGSVNWVCHFDSNGWPVASPVVGPDGTIYQALVYDANLYAIDPNNGDIIWAADMADTDSGLYEPFEFSTDGYPIVPPSKCTQIDPLTMRCYLVGDSGWSEPAVGPDGTIYVSLADDPHLRGVDPNGSIKWVTQLGYTTGLTLTVGSDGLVYAAGDYKTFKVAQDMNCLFEPVYPTEDSVYLHVVDANGSQIAEYDSNEWLGFPVISAEGTVVLANPADNTLLIAYEKNAATAISKDSCASGPLPLYWLVDTNRDGQINMVDFASVASEWLSCTDLGWPCYYCEEVFTDPWEFWNQEYLAGDSNRDLYLDIHDLAALAGRWLAGE